MQYAYQLLRQDSIPVKDACTMLRDYSVAIAGLEITRRKKTNAELLAEDLLKAFTQRIEIDLKDDLFKGVIPNDTTQAIMLDKTFCGKKRNLTTKQLVMKAKADAKRLKLNLPLLVNDGQFKSADCVTIYKRCKANVLNNFNSALFKLLNKDSGIPSGKQLIELLNKVRAHEYQESEEKRVKILLLSRIKAKEEKKKQKNDKEENTNMISTPSASTTSTLSLRTPALSTNDPLYFRCIVIGCPNQWEDQNEFCSDHQDQVVIESDLHPEEANENDLDVEMRDEDEEIIGDNDEEDIINAENKEDSTDNQVENKTEIDPEKEDENKKFKTNIQNVNNDKKVEKISPSKIKKMPESYIPQDFLIWLSRGPLSDDPVTEFMLNTADVTGSSNKRSGADILDVNSDKSGGGGKNSRNRQKLNENQLRNGDSQIVEKNDEGNDKNKMIDLMKESMNNNKIFFNSINSKENKEQKLMNLKVTNARDLWDLYKDEEECEDKIEAKKELIKILKLQKALLEQLVKVVEVVKLPILEG